jgi:hypothetical protein
MMRTRILVPLIALTFTLSGCIGTPTAGVVAPEASAPTTTQQVLDNGTVVDGIRLGTATDCAGPDCETRLKLATADAMSRHDLAASAIGPAHFYLPYVPPGATLGSGGGYIVVLDLDDGSRAAVYTFCFTTCGVVTQSLAPLNLAGSGDHGPLVDPLVEARLDCSSPEHPSCNDAVQVAIATATTNGFIAPATIADTHYYVDYVTPGSPEAAAFEAEYIVHLYIAGDHDNLAESAIGVYCGSGPCQTVSLPDGR